MTPQSPSKWAPWDLTQFSQSLLAAPIVFSWISSMVWNLFPFKGYCSFGKARSYRAPNLDCRGAESPGDLMFCEKTLHRRDAWVSALSWWSCQSPVAHSLGLLNHLKSFCGGIIRLKTKFDADSSLYSLSHFECNNNTVHMLTQWCLQSPLTCTVKLSLFTHVHSSPLSLAARLHRCCSNHSGYINNDCTFSGQTS